MQSPVWAGTSSRRFGIGSGASPGRFGDSAPRLPRVGVFSLGGLVTPGSKPTRPVLNCGVCGARKHSPRIQDITFHIALMFCPLLTEHLLACEAIDAMKKSLLGKIL
jgi:hypothetical protein